VTNKVKLIIAGAVLVLGILLPIIVAVSIGSITA